MAVVISMNYIKQGYVYIKTLTMNTIKMENTIKFQAWDTVLNCFVEPSHYLVGFDGKVYFKLGDQLIDQTFKLKLRRFTGLKDKNGKEIYEGDILGLDDKEDNSRCLVVFYNGCFKKEFISDSDGEKFYSNFDRLDLTMWKVIGNIYENPELLTPQP